MIDRIFFITLLLLTINLNITYANEDHFKSCGYLGLGYVDYIHTTIFVEEKTNKYFRVLPDNLNSNFENFRSKYVCLNANQKSDNTLEVISVQMDTSKVRKDVQPNESCQVYIDRIATNSITNRGTFYYYQFFIKAIKEKLDGNILKVGSIYRYGANSPWKLSENLAKNIGTYGDTDLIGQSFDRYRDDLEVAFFVETDNFTKYWIKPEVNGELTNFKFHWHTFEYLKKLFGHNWTIDDLTKTADFNTYYNPFGCK